MIITIDGSAGTGKTTVAKRVAERLHLPYFDTGAMYRAVTWAILEQEIPLTHLWEIEQLLSTFSFKIKEENKQPRYFVGDVDVTEEIRSQPVTQNVSAISALPLIRKALWKIQLQFASQGSAVFEGRDMGTAVFPHAEIKIFLTARPEIRAQRRLEEILNKNPRQAAYLNPEKMLEELVQRDAVDSSRQLAPLKCPEDALIIDTSDLSIDAVVECILRYHKEKFQSPS
jgi:CMP/dCMP kinase